MADAWRLVAVLTAAAQVGMALPSGDAALQIDLGDGASGVALDIARDRVYVTLTWSDELVTLDGGGTVLGRMTVGDRPQSVEASPTDGAVYVGLVGPSEVWAVDPATQEVRWKTAPGLAPWHLALDAASGVLHVASYLDSKVVSVDTRTGLALPPMGLTSEGGIRGLAVDPMTHLVYAASCDGVKVLDPVGSVALVPLQPGKCYSDVAMHLPMRSLYAPSGGRLEVLHPLMGWTLGPLRPTQLVESYLVAADPSSTLAYTAFLPIHCRFDGGSVFWQDWVTGVYGRVSTGACPLDLEVDPVHHLLYVAAEDGTLTIAPTPRPSP